MAFEILKGGCHCGAVQFQVTTQVPLPVITCNCSICDKTGFLHLIVRKENFKLLTDPKELTTYSFNTGVAQHMFCKTCGIKSFYVPRSNPDGYSVNVRCLEGYPNLPMETEDFDGQNWEKEGANLKHLTD